MKLSKLLLNIGLYSSVFAVSGGSAYLICYSQKNNNVVNIDQNNTKVYTPAERMVNSMTNLQTFDLDATIEAIDDSSAVETNINFNASIDVTDLSDVKLNGTLSGRASGMDFKATIGYYDKSLYFDYNDSHMYLATDNIMDFVDTLPSMGITFELPDSIKNLDINALESDLENLEPVKDVNGYYFPYQLTDDIQLMFTSDNDYQFTGVRTNKFYFGTYYIQLKGDIDSDCDPKFTLVNPTTVENAPTYYNFSPAFNLFNGLYNLYQDKDNTLQLAVDLDRTDSLTQEVSDFIDVNLDFTYDLASASKAFDVKGTVAENENLHNVDLTMLNNTMYFNYNDAIKISLDNGSIAGLMDYLVSKIDNETIKSIFNSLSEKTNDIDLTGLLSNIRNLNSLANAITVDDNTLGIQVDLSSLGIDDLNAEKMTLKFTYDTEKFLGFSIDDININGYKGSIELTQKDYTPISIETSEYANLLYPLRTTSHIEDLIGQEKYRLEFSGSVTNDDASILPISINGGLQFDTTDQIENGYGYGEVTLVDRDNYSHNIYVDLKDKNEVLFRYNQTMKGKFTTQSVLDIVDLVKQIFNDKDAHFMELFGDTLDAMNESEISKIINEKNYGKLLASNIISNLQTTESCLSFDIDSTILGINSEEYKDKNKFTVKINYEYNPNNEYCTIKSMDISNLYVKGETIDFTMSLKAFDDTLESTRLNVSDEYLDFSDIKFLLSLGLNTSRVDDWEFDAKVKVTLGLAGVNLLSETIPTNIKIHNNKGKVSAIITLSDIPAITGVNPNRKYYNAKNRNVTLYYHDGYFYGYRTEEARKNWYSLSYGTYTATFKATQQYFMDNILYYLCDFTLGLSESLMNTINDSINDSSSSTTQIKYEDVLTDFSYNSTASTPYYRVALDMGVLAKNDDLEQLVLKIYRDVANDRLQGLDATLSVSVGVSIGLNASLSLVNFGQEIDLTSLTTYVNNHANDSVDTSYTESFK